MSARAPGRGRADRVYQRVISPALPRRCKYEPTLLALRGRRRSGEYGILRGLVLAGWRAAALQPVEPRRLRPGRRPATVPPPRTRRTLT